MSPPESAACAAPPDGGYGWVVVGAAFTALAVIFGVAYAFAAFFESFAADFRAQRADVALVFGVSGLLYFVLGAGAGMLADRVGPRAVAGAGMLCIALGLLGCSLAPSLGTVYLAYGAGIGLGVALVYTPAIGCVPPWFVRRRALAAGIASAGIGAGTLAVPLLAGAAITAVGWRTAMQAMAALVLVVGLGATALLRRAPTARGSSAAPAPGLPLRAVVRSAPFGWLYLATLLSGPAMFIPFAHVTVAARDLGVDLPRAVGLVGLIGVGSLAGRFAIGALADRLGRARTLALALASMGLAYLLWAGAAGYTLLAAFALGLGLSYGGIVALLPALCMDFFGARAVSSVIGTLYTGAALGNLAGPVLAGWVFDRYGGYQPVIWSCLLLSGLAALAATRLPKRAP